MLSMKNQIIESHKASLREMQALAAFLELFLKSSEAKMYKSLEDMKTEKDPKMTELLTASYHHYTNIVNLTLTEQSDNNASILEIKKLINNALES